MSEPSLTEFLEQRIAEDEAAIPSSLARVTTPEGVVLYADQAANRVLAECAAMRAIVGLHTGSVQDCVGHDDPADPRCPTLRHLASIWADRDDFDPEWRVS